MEDIVIDNKTPGMVQREKRDKTIIRLNAEYAAKFPGMSGWQRADRIARKIAEMASSGEFSRSWTRDRIRQRMLSMGIF